MQATSRPGSFAGVFSAGGATPDLSLYNVIAGGSVALTFEAVDADGVTILADSVTVTTTAASLMKLVLAKTDQPTYNRIVGLLVKGASDVYFNTSGSDPAGTVNSPSPATTSLGVWGAGLIYKIGWVA